MANLPFSLEGRQWWRTALCEEMIAQRWRTARCEGMLIQRWRTARWFHPLGMCVTTGQMVRRVFQRRKNTAAKNLAERFWKSGRSFGSCGSEANPASSQPSKLATQQARKAQLQKYTPLGVIVQIGRCPISELAGILRWSCKISPRSSHPSRQRCCIHSEFAAPGTEIRSQIPVRKSGPFPCL